MLTSDNENLQIFQNFIIDKKLPKHKSENFNLSEDSEPDSSFMSIGGGSVFTNGNEVDDNFIYKNGIFTKIKASFKERISFLFTGEAVKKTKTKPKPITITPMEFFKSIKNNSKELSKIEKRVEGYLEALKHAKLMGQTALEEKLTKQIDVVRSETQLYASGFKTIIEEEQIVKFYKKSEKGIRLDYIKNFTRVIPSDFLETKKLLDEKCIFDNYAIMHYDKDTKGFALTAAEEEERAKDPILFGLIDGSRKLYYIGDWEDEYCDLTLENFIDEFGKKAINKNNLTAKIKL